MSEGFFVERDTSMLRSRGLISTVAASRLFRHCGYGSEKDTQSRPLPDPNQQTGHFKPIFVMWGWETEQGTQRVSLGAKG